MWLEFRKTLKVSMFKNQHRKNFSHSLTTLVMHGSSKWSNSRNHPFMGCELFWCTSCCKVSPESTVELIHLARTGCTSSIASSPENPMPSTLRKSYGRTFGSSWSTWNLKIFLVCDSRLWLFKNVSRNGSSLSQLIQLLKRYFYLSKQSKLIEFRTKTLSYLLGDCLNIC